MSNEMKNKITLSNVDYMAIIFSVMIIANNTFEMDAVLYVFPKMLMFLFFAVMSVFVVLNIKNKEPLNCKNLIFPVLFFAWESLSLIWSADRAYSLFRWETQAQLFLLFLFVYYYMRTNGSVKTFLVATYLSGYALLIYTVSRYGLANIFTLVSDADRLGGEINNANTYGMFFASAVLVAFYFITQKKSKLHIVSIVLFSYFALASGSKKAAVMILAGIVGISVLAYGIKRMWKLLLVLALLIAIILVVINMNLFPSLVERLTSFLAGELNAGDSVREIFRETGLELITKRPLFGYGLAVFAKVTGIGTYSHDNFIEICVSSGIVGLLLYYIPWFYSALVLLKDFFEKKGDSLILFMFVILYIVMGVGNVQYESRDVWIFLAVVLAVIDKEKQAAEAEGYAL